MVDFGCKSVQTSPMPYQAHSAPELNEIEPIESFYKIQPQVPKSNTSHKSPLPPLEPRLSAAGDVKSPTKSVRSNSSPVHSPAESPELIKSPADSPESINSPLESPEPIKPPQPTLEELLNQPVLDAPLSKPSFSELDGILGLTKKTPNTPDPAPKVKFFVFDELTEEKWYEHSIKSTIWLSF